MEHEPKASWRETFRQSPIVHMIAAVILVLLMGLVDYLTGTELHASIFYVLPVWYATWTVGRWPGVAISALSAVSWFLADYFGAPVYSHPFIPYWNAMVQLAFYLVVTFAVAALRNAMRLQDQLTAFVIHDLRAPLANIMMALDLIRRSAGDSLDAREKRLVRIATEAGGQMSRLINTLLDLSRLRHHSMPVEAEALDVGGVTAKAATVMTPWAEDRGVTIVVEQCKDKVRAYGDPDMTHRVVVNLLSNAIKYTPKGGKVTLSASPRGGTAVEVRVSDEGPGIPREWRDRAFDMYAQLEAQRGSAAVGSGLGLAFSRMAVEAQGGRIWLDSSPEEGTTVTFTLPTEAAAAEGRKAALGPMKRRKPHGDGPVGAPDSPDHQG